MKEKQELFVLIIDHPPHKAMDDKRGGENI